ncbi:MAG: ABC transporter transmembrane domain-containing protein, partial [Erysipelotrichaceae bacterium]
MRRSGFNIMIKLIALIKPLWHVMLLCICLGVLGFLAAISINVLAVNLLLIVINSSPLNLTFKTCALIIIVCAILRAVLRYGEQTCGHFIAFKLLATLRDKIFAVLRKLAPAKLENKEKGNLISLISSDIELLEVFYAHTIAPVAIAFIVSFIMVVGIAFINVYLAVLALSAYVIVGIIVPIASANIGRKSGMATRNKIGELNSYFLESVRGIKEVIQFQQIENRAKLIVDKTLELNDLQSDLKKNEGVAGGLAGALVMFFTVLILISAIVLDLSFSDSLLATIMLSASFGPVLALANLSATLNLTMASGERVLNLLNEEALVSVNT